MEGKKILGVESLGPGHGSQENRNSKSDMSQMKVSEPSSSFKKQKGCISVNPGRGI